MFMSDGAGTVFRRNDENPAVSGRFLPYQCRQMGLLVQLPIGRIPQSLTSCPRGRYRICRYSSNVSAAIPEMLTLS